MKTKIIFCRFLFLLWAVSAVAVQTAGQNFRAVRRGVEYAEITRGGSEAPVHINLLRLDLRRVWLNVVHARDRAIGLEKTSVLAARHKAIAAINAGFFRLDRSLFAGDAVGVLQIDRRLLSESYGNRIALGIYNGKNVTEIEFGHLKSESVVGFGAGSQFSFSGVNRERKAGEIVLYTPEFNSTTLTEQGGTEILLSQCLPSGASVRCLETKVSEGKGNSPIPAGGYVISIAPDALEKSNGILAFAAANTSPLENKFDNILRLVDRVETLDAAKQKFFSRAEDIVTGVPQLIKNGKIEITWEQEKSSKAFVETRHPRTAIARLKDGKFLMVTIDGRQPGYSVGMSLPELAAFLLEMGAIDAMNLDGGGSTTMFLEGKIVNKPSDKEGERSVSDALLVFPR